MKKAILVATFISLAVVATGNALPQRQEEIVSRYFWLKEEALVSLANPRGSN